MAQRQVPWIDPVTGGRLTLDGGGDHLAGGSSRYPVRDGIPNFVGELADPDQTQVKKTFGYKWNRTDFGQDDKSFKDCIRPVCLDMLGIKESDLEIFDGKIVLDVGVGSGSSARLWGERAREFHGIDISDAVYRAPNVLVHDNAFFAQCDLNFLPFPDGSFDVIVSNGVLHHTENTRGALQNIIRKLKAGGLCLFYVYKKKAPLREYSDDYIRSLISDMPEEEAERMLEPLTRLARELSEQRIVLQISEDLDLLGIKRGKYDLQRFLYQFVFKCFWNKKWGFEDSNMVNFDWYYPKYAWRQSEAEIREWCRDLGLGIQYIIEGDSGYTCLVKK